MTKVFRSMMVLSALAGALTLSAQTADEIAGKYMAAIGGKEAIGKVKSLSMETSVNVMGNDAPSTTRILDGVGYRTDTDINGTKIIQCVNDKGGWIVNPMIGASEPISMPDDEYKIDKDQIFIGGALYNYAAKGSKLELLGKDAASYRLRVTNKDNVEAIYVIDASTYFVNSVTRKGKVQDQTVDVTSTFSDYRKTDLGYSLPYAITVDFGGQFSLSITVKKVEFNKPIDPSVFTMPNPATRAGRSFQPAVGLSFRQQFLSLSTIPIPVPCATPDILNT